MIAIISTNAIIAIANDDDIVEHNNDTEADADFDLDQWAWPLLDSSFSQ